MGAVGSVREPGAEAAPIAGVADLKAVEPIGLAILPNEYSAESGVIS